MSTGFHSYNIDRVIKQSQYQLVYYVPCGENIHLPGSSFQDHEPDLPLDIRGKNENLY